MRIELDYEEVKSALAKAIEEKTNFMFGEIDPDYCFFSVIDSTGKEIEIESVSFFADV